MHIHASAKAIGSIFVLDNHHVAFKNRKLKETKQSYSTHEKKIAITMHYLDVWRQYLLGRKFGMVIDNVANMSLKTQKNLTRKQAWWQKYLGEFNFNWVHHPKRQN